MLSSDIKNVNQDLLSILNQADLEFGHFPEKVFNNTSGNIPVYWAPGTSTGIIVEQSDLKKIADKYDLLSEYLLNEMNRFFTRVDNLQNLVISQSREILAFRKEMNLNKLEKIASYPNNWAGENTVSFSQRVIELTRKILLLPELKLQPQIFPTRRNSIQLEFQDGDDKYLEIEIFSDKFIYFKEIFGKESENESTYFSSIVSIVNEFRSK